MQQLGELHTEYNIAKYIQSKPFTLSHPTCLSHSAGKTAAITTEERQLHNPVYDGTSQQIQSVPQQGPAYEAIQLPYNEHMTNPALGAGEVTYEEANEQSGVSYSAVGDRVDANSQPYNVLVHSTERSPSFVPPENYSTLQA